ncbi:NLR family CARD domain-containing protein 3-like [Ixodes scapularis]|uniref:NLR family CARD domain-containing protein 3-like n=1 Tax=Ixodes scapularis TaxID=6945 RepID=UPI001C382E49|nr:NLR family CARD domain-containing protein 3-like [Ixodes scapularis]
MSSDKDLLDSNMVGVRGAQRFAKLLRTNKTLLSVSLFTTKIIDKGAVAIGQALAANSTLELLMIGGNSIGPTGAQAIASSLELNTTLTYVDLQCNHLDNSGAVFLARMLQSNKTLRTLDMGRSFIRSDGIVAIADSLTNNPTLLELSIDGSLFTEEAVAAFARLVASKKTLKHFHATPGCCLRSAAPFKEFVEALALNRLLAGIEFSAEYPCSMQTLLQKLRCHETLRDLSIQTNALDTSLLFNALASNRSVRTFEVDSVLSLRSLMALANLLRVTTTIRPVTVMDKVRNTSLMWLVRGLASNSSIWRFRDCSNKLGVSLGRTIATMLVENITLSVLILDAAPVDELGLVTLFVLKIATDNSSAAAFQLYRRNEYFVHELSLRPEGLSAFSVDSLVCEANKYILENYFVITGVVKGELVCLRPQRRTALTAQLDELNAYCLYVVASYLKVSDVKG